ncbi:tape measure protein [Acinetobacter pittii]|uniref:tape measure protein n=1 Tax=Acinetobacter pittii TaxID=48296 RepID=UPI00300A8E76
MAQESRLVIVIDAKNAERNARNLGNELDSIERKGDFATKSMDALSVATRQLAGYMAGLVTVSAAISKMDTYTGLQNRLKLVTNSQVELNKATEDTFRIAQKTYSTWNSVLQVYQRFSDNAKTLNLTMDDTARLTETVSKAVAISGASAEAADAALVQFGQALASGTLRGEELNSVMEQTPALAKAIAQGMGITVGELRSVAAEGKITSQEIVKALRNVESDVDALFGKTDITIGQSLTLLNNEITKFVGEAGKGSGAAQVLSGSIQVLSSNLNLLADGALIAGIGLITRAILLKGAAVKEGIVSTLASRQASITKAQAELGEAAATLNTAKAHLANVQATNAETQAKYGATAAALRYTQAQAVVTAATNAQTAAQTRLTAATSLAGGIGSRALGLIGGPIGAITIGITALAAGYMYFQDKAAKANKKLEEQAEVAKRAKDELLALRGLEKDSAINDMTASFERQNKALAESSSKINIQLNAIAQLYKGNKEIVQVVNQAKDGTISMNEAVKRFNELRISRDIYNALKENSAEFEKNAKEAKTTKESLKLFSKEVKLSGHEAQTAVAGIDDNSKALIGNESAAQKAAKAQKGYFESLRTEVLNSNEELALLNLGYSEETVKKINELQKAKQAVAPPGTTAIVTNEEIERIVRAQKALDVLKDKKDELAAAERKQNKESEKKLKITQAELEVAKRSAALIESSGLGKYAESKGIPSSVIAGLLAQESKGIREAKSHTGAIGYFQTTSGYRKQNNMSVADSYDLEKSGKIVIDNIAKVYEKTGDLAQAILSHNAGEGGARQFTKTGKVKGSAERNKEVSQYVAKVSRYSDIIAGGVGKGGLSDGDSDRAYGEQIKARLELVKQGLNLQEQYEEEQAKRTKARNEEINLAQQTGQTALIPKIKERYKAQDELAKLQQDFEVNGYKWTEEEKLDYTYKTNSLRLVAEGKLSEDQRKVALDGLKLQKQQELGLLKLAQEQRLFQAKLFLLSETEAMQERYRLEREEIAKTAKDEEEKRKRLALSRDQERLEALDRAAKAGQAWGGIQADMNGSGEFYRLDQERSSRLSAATNLLDSQQGVVNLNEQNSIEALNAQFEQQLISQQDYENQKTAIIQAAQDQRNQIAAEHAKNAQDIEDKYQQDRLNTQIAFGGQMMGSLTSMFGSMFGEQSKAYKIMFAADKAYAIAAAGIAIQQSIAQAAKVGFPKNIPLIASAIAQGASIIANIRAIKDQGFADGGYTGSGGKYEPAGIVHKGEVVWSQEDIKRWGGVGLVENMRKSANPEAFINNHATNNTSVENVFNRSFLSSKAFNDNQVISNIFNQPIRENQIITKGFANGGFTGGTVSKPTASSRSDLFHDGKVYFSSNGLVQNRSNLDDVQDFTLGRISRPQAEMMPSIEPSTPTINFKIEVINQVSGATVEAEKLDEKTVRIIVKEELDKQLPKAVPRLVSEDIKNPNSLISRSLSENTTARRNR